MYDIRALEYACSEAMPPQVVEPLGQWRLRAADGFTSRANSALAVGDPGVPLPEALAAVCEFAHRHGIAPQLVHPDLGGPVVPALTEAGWVVDEGKSPNHEIAVLIGPMPDAPSRHTVVREAPWGTWWRLGLGTETPTEAQRQVYAGRAELGFGLAEVDGAPAGIVRGAIAEVEGDRLLYLGALAVDPAFRRRGLAADLLAGIAEWARPLGAKHGVLQVAVRNPPALALYRRLGFTEHHRYRYWVPGPASTGACEDHRS